MNDRTMNDNNFIYKGCSEVQGDLDRWRCRSCGDEWWQETDWPSFCPWCGHGEMIEDDDD